jgi:hypothetical protein
MHTLLKPTIGFRWVGVVAVLACNVPDAPMSPPETTPALGLGVKGCPVETPVTLAAGASKRLTDKEAACLSFKGIAGSRYLLAYADTRLVTNAQTKAEWPWPDSAYVIVQDVVRNPFTSVAPSSVTAPEPGDPREHVPAAQAFAAASSLPSSCPLLNTFYPHCRATPYTVGQAITHYPGGGRPPGAASILTVVGNLALAVFTPDDDVLVPNAKARADSALEWIAKRNIPLSQKAFSLANPTTTSDESGQLYLALQAASSSGAGWWPDQTNGHGRWARITIALSANSAFGDPSSSYTNALQVLGHEVLHSYQYRWRYEHAGPWVGNLGTSWAIEGGAAFLAQEMVRDRLGIPFTRNTYFGATQPQDPAFPLIGYGLRVRNFTFGYGSAASLLRDLVQRLVVAGLTYDDAVLLVLRGAMEGWYGINEEGQYHPLGLSRRMQAVFGRSWNPTDALLQWTMTEAADDLTSNKTYQNLTKKSYDPSTATNAIIPDALIVPGSSVAVLRAPGTTGVFEIDGSTPAAYRATSNITRLAETPFEWLLLRIK